MKESILSIVLMSNISYMMNMVLTRKTGERPAQAYPYCEMDEDSRMPLVDNWEGAIGG